MFLVTLGPRELLGRFAKRTHELNDAVMLAIALQAFGIAAVAVVAGGFVGGTGLSGVAAQPERQSARAPSVRWA